MLNPVLSRSKLFFEFHAKAAKKEEALNRDTTPQLNSQTRLDKERGCKQAHSSIFFLSFSALALRTPTTLSIGQQNQLEHKFRKNQQHMKKTIARDGFGTPIFNEEKNLFSLAPFSFRHPPTDRPPTERTPPVRWSFRSSSRIRNGWGGMKRGAVWQFGSLPRV